MNHKTSRWTLKDLFGQVLFKTENYEELTDEINNILILKEMDSDKFIRTHTIREEDASTPNELCIKEKLEKIANETGITQLTDTPIIVDYLQEEKNASIHYPTPNIKHTRIYDIILEMAKKGDYKGIRSWIIANINELYKITHYDKYGEFYYLINIIHDIHIKTPGEIYTFIEEDDIKDIIRYVKRTY